MAKRLAERIGTLLAGACLALAAEEVQAQTFGIELHNTMMPAAAGMGGVGIARPQDLTSALNANPAALTQFEGTQFTFGGGWAEPTINLTQTRQIPPVGGGLVDPFSAKSSAPGTPLGNIGVTQSLDALGMPATFGIGFITTSGALVDYRSVPESHGTSSGMLFFSMPLAVGVLVTEELSVGATMALGIGFFDGPFVGTSGMSADYALRGTLGANYLLSETTTFGAYYQTEQKFRFDDAFTLNPGVGQILRDVNLDLPQNIGFGLANTAILDGKLLLGVDVLYKMWDDASMFKAIYDDQWVVQLGAQYTSGRYKLRTGYVWAEDPLKSDPGSDFGGVVQPGGLAAVRYSQAQLAVTSPHRISMGVGVADVLPGVSLDLSAGGMFRDTSQLGEFTTSSISSYWLATGLTWKFGACRAAPPQ